MMLATNLSVGWNIQILKWIVENLNWIVPMMITIIFSCLNIHGANINQKTAEAQAKLQNDSFCYQLFDRRMHIYTRIKEILAEVIGEGRVRNELVSAYLRETREVPMLFGPEVVQKVDELYDLLLRYHVVSEQVCHNIECQKVTPNHVQLCEQDSELLLSISNENSNLIKTFEAYISFRDYKISSEEKVKK